MKHLLFLMMIIFFGYNAYSQLGQSSTLKDFKLNKEVKEITVKNFIANMINGELSKGELSSPEIGFPIIFTLKFNKSGFLTEKINYKSDSSLDDFRLFTYDENNKLLKYTLYEYDSSIVGTCNYTYINSITVIGDYTSSTNNNSKEKFTLNEDNNITRIENQYFKADTIDFWSERTFTYYPNMIAIHGKSQDNNSASYLIIKDIIGNTLEIIQIDDFINWRKSSKYDENSMVIEEITIREGVTTSEKYSYKLDKNGNWISKVTTINDEPKYITTREITYY